MKQREHLNQPTTAPADAPAQENQLNAIRSEVNDLLSAADRAFQRVRSEDSEGFLSRIRQNGGQ